MVMRDRTVGCRDTDTSAQREILRLQMLLARERERVAELQQELGRLKVRLAVRGRLGDDA